jgi:Xaa-Pro dipeptidase
MSSVGPAAEPYPRFSDSEMARRRRSLDSLLAAAGTPHVLLYGVNRFGSAVGWLTRWPVTREALVVHTPGERPVLLVAFYNHVPNARRLATEADVRWAGSSIVHTGLEELERRGGRGAHIGIIGPLGHGDHRVVADFAGEVVDLDSAFTGLRLIKSDEELEWVRIGCALTDAGILALQGNEVVGKSEWELCNLVERAYVGRGGTTHIHYFGATPMEQPAMGVPGQWPSTRRLQSGDALTCEISASYWDYPGQVLRTFAVGRDPTPLYVRLHDAADAAFDEVCSKLRAGATAEDVVPAAGVIEDEGFTTRDDLVHGFVGGYLPPVLGSKSRTLDPVPRFTFKAGMTVVVQPNVVTPDEQAGVQTGELVLITQVGVGRLHSVPRGFLRTD